MSANENSKLKNWLLEQAIVKRTQEFLRSKTPWGIDGMNLYDVLRFFIMGLVNGSVSIRSAAISFRLLVAVFPAIILLLSVLPYTPLKAADVIDFLRDFFPGETIMLLKQTIDDLLDKTQGTLLSIGFVLTLIYASNSISAILTSFNASYLIENKGKGWYAIFNFYSTVYFANSIYGDCNTAHRIQWKTLNAFRVRGLFTRRNSYLA